MKRPTFQHRSYWNRSPAIIASATQLAFPFAVSLGTKKRRNFAHLDHLRNAPLALPLPGSVDDALLRDSNSFSSPTRNTR
jgi:hypothetical protein